MIPSPGDANPAPDVSHATSGAGHTCWVCGQPIPADLWDMTVFATPTAVAYLPCFFTAIHRIPPAA